MKHRITITNSFHNSSVRLDLPDDGILSTRQVRRARRELCGIPTCVCGGNLGERGKQFAVWLPNLPLFECEPLEDGRIAIVFFE